MEILMDAASGAYRVVTLASTYVIDLDREVIRREPRPGHPDSTLLPRNEPITLLEVIDCCVGRPMILLIDLLVCGISLAARFTTQGVTSIGPVPSSERETAR